MNIKVPISEFPEASQVSGNDRMIIETPEGVTKSVKSQVIIDSLSEAAGDKNFVYNQVIPSDTWVVNHNLGKHPAVTVVDSSGQRVVGEERHVSTDQLLIYFQSGAFSGTVFCN